MKRPRITTRVAVAGLDEHRFRGHAVFSELVSRLSFTGLVSLAITGRVPDDETVAVLDEIACTLTLADPRFWHLKVSRMAASFGSSMLGTCLGPLALEGALIGSSVPPLAAKWLVRYVEGRKGGGSIESMVEEIMDGKSHLPGFGLPGRKVDERTECLKGRLRSLGRDRLPYWKSFWEVADSLAGSPRMTPNHAGAAAAAFLDSGYSPDEIRHLAPILPLPTFLANAVEGAEQRSSILRRLPLECITFEGSPARRSPRALADGDDAPESR